RKNLNLALEYYMRAALNGEKQSVYEVGRMYYHGIGVEKNRKLAKVWYEHAKKLGID
ncbi:MAG TPA: sel1 repeat family protein, partial [Nitrospirae bacterium]|nr:sel1 repeat family protein [Nitrospirota bacterium]